MASAVMASGALTNHTLRGRAVKPNGPARSAFEALSPGQAVATA